MTSPAYPHEFVLFSKTEKVLCNTLLFWNNIRRQTWRWLQWDLDGAEYEGDRQRFDIDASSLSYKSGFWKHWYDLRCFPEYRKAALNEAKAGIEQNFTGQVLRIQLKRIQLPALEGCSDIAWSSLSFNKRAMLPVQALGKFVGLGNKALDRMNRLECVR